MNRHIQLLSWSSAGPQVSINDAAKDFNDAAKRTMLRRELSNEHWRCAQNGSKQLADTDNTKFSAAFSALFIWTRKHMIPEIWKYWMTSTMTWHWKENCNVENSSLCCLLATKYSNMSDFCQNIFRGRINPRFGPQIQARCAEDVDVVLQAEYWVMI